MRVVSFPDDGASCDFKSEELLANVAALRIVRRLGICSFYGHLNSPTSKPV